MEPILKFILLAVLVLLAAITAATETSIIAASRIKLKKLSGEGSKTAKMILKILEAPERFFGAILVANNIVDILLASIITAIMIILTGEETKGVLLATAIATFVIIVSEVTAKTLAARHAERLALVLARPVQGLIYLFSPIVKVLSAITNFILAIFGSKAKGRLSLITEEEIKALIKIGEEEGIMQKEKSKMLSKIFDFSDKLVKDVLTPKEKVVAINAAEDLAGILNKALESGYSRLPVYRDSPDKIIGIINMKDLLNISVNKGLVVLQDIIYPPIFVSSNKKVAELLREFQKGHTHLAIVNDAQGKIIGLVTLEDLLEEIVGEIKDEYDVRDENMYSSF